ncbi:hypothetical protein GCM10010441_36230 [Kitasatospora paracochleata]
MERLHEAGRPRAPILRYVRAAPRVHWYRGLSVAGAKVAGMDEEALMRGRVYGADHDDPDPGPKPGRAYRELCGGPLDGLLLDVTGRGADELRDGAALWTEIGRYGPGGHAHYTPRPADPRRWDWTGDSR